MAFILLVASALFILLVLSESQPNLRRISGRTVTKNRILTRQQVDYELSLPTITPFTDICEREYPPLHPTLHDQNLDNVEHFTISKDTVTERWNGYGLLDFPDFVQMKSGAKYNLRKFDMYNARASAWDPDTNFVVEGPWFIHPTATELQSSNVIELQGDYVAYNTWIGSNYAHFMFDWLPTISFLRSVFPETTKIILAYHEISEKILKFLDEEFVNNRVHWIHTDQVFQIKGNFTVTVPLGVPEVHGCCKGWDPMRQWIAEKHPVRIEKKHVLYYKRGGETTKGGRVLNPSLEESVLNIIRQKVMQYGRDEEIKIFTGEDENGQVLSMEEQFYLFRGASTIIGPHGSGISGNFAWTDPFPSNCEERPQLLEFTPGRENSQIHALYADSFGNIRKWPLEFHALLYTDIYPNITYTNINLEDFESALDVMWGNTALKQS